MKNNMWLLFAVLSAVFAAATSILAKMGIRDVDSSLATAIRTAVVLVMSWVVVIVAHRYGHPSGSLFSEVHGLTPYSWLFLVLSGLSTGASWLCYFYAVKYGPVGKVVAIDKCSLVLTLLFAASFLDETLTWKTAAGCLLIMIGTFIMIC